MIRIYTVNDLFCGAGGMGLGFKQEGFKLVGAFDFDKYAVQSYKHNVENHVQQVDIREMDWSNLPRSDVWTFGFPCQDLSIAGKRKGLYNGERSNLFFEVMRLLDETQNNNPEQLPRVIVAENVKGLKPYLDVLKEEYNKRNYDMYYTIYNSKYWGVPQNRERYFVVGINRDNKLNFEFENQQTDFIPLLSSVLENTIEGKYYFSSDKSQKIINEIEQKRSSNFAEELICIGSLQKNKAIMDNLSPTLTSAAGMGGGHVAMIVTIDEKYYMPEEKAKTIIEKALIKSDNPQDVYTDKTGCAYACDANYYKGTSPGDVGKGRRTHIIEGVSCKKTNSKRICTITRIP